MIPPSVKFAEGLRASLANGWPVTMKSLDTLIALVLLDVQHPPPPVPLPPVEELDE